MSGDAAGEPSDASDITRFMFRTVGWRALTGQTATLRGVLDRLKRYSLSQIVGMVSRTTLALSLEDPTGSDGDELRTRQMRILSRFLGKHNANQLAARAGMRLSPSSGPERWVIFHERQTLNALKLAFLAIDLELGSVDRERSTVPFIEALLMINDLMDAHLEGLDFSTDAGLSQLELYAAANVIFNEGSHMLRDYVRAHHLFIEPRPEVAFKGAVDVPSALARATGLSADTTWHALMAILSKWLTLAWKDIDAGDIWQHRALWLDRRASLTEEERERWLALACIDAADLQLQIREGCSLDDPRYFDVLSFEKHPVVAFGDTLYCVSLPLLRRLPGSSLQHRFLDTSIFNPRETRAFLDTRGHLVERYSDDLLARAFGDRFVSERKMQECVGEEQSVCDGMIVYPDAVILLEFKTSTPLLNTRHATDYAGYRKKLRNAVRKAADQFVSTNSLLRSDDFAKLGVRSSAIKRIYTAVGIFEQVITQFTYRAIIRDDLADHPLMALVQGGQVAPIQFLHIAELEAWELAAPAGRSVLELLHSKTSNPRFAEMPFFHFLQVIGATFQDEHGPWYEARFNANTAAGVAFYESLGYSIDDPGR